jgi:hypothetical protein
MEDDLNGRRPLWKMTSKHSFSNHKVDLTQIIKLSSGNQTKTCEGLSQRQTLWNMTSMEDDLKNFKMYFLSNNWADLNQFLNLTSGEQTKTDKLN